MPTKTTSIEESAAATLKRLEEKDRGLKQMVKKAYAYAVFPSVGKASLVVGGSYGRGAVFEKGKFIGHATISQFTIGVQIGGDTFTEVLVFHDPGQLDRFKSGHMAFAANASAVLVKAAAAGTTDFKGVTALAYSSGGMLLELSLGGQKFRFKPLGEGKGDESGGGKGKAGKAESSSGQGEEADEESDSDEESGSEDEDSENGDGMLRRAVSGLAKAKDVATKATEAARAHPMAATAIGAGVVTGLALVLLRTLRQGSQGSSDSESDYDEQDDEESEENDTDAQGSDEGEEDYDGEGEDEEQEEQGSSRRRGRARA